MDFSGQTPRCYNWLSSPRAPHSSLLRSQCLPPTEQGEIRRATKAELCMRDKLDRSDRRDRRGMRGRRGSRPTAIPTSSRATPPSASHRWPTDM